MGLSIPISVHQLVIPLGDRAAALYKREDGLASVLMEGNHANAMSRIRTQNVGGIRFAFLGVRRCSEVWEAILATMAIPKMP